MSLVVASAPAMCTCPLSCYLKDQERVPWPLVTQLTRPSCSAVFLVLHLSVKLGGMKEIPMGLTKVNIKPYPKTML